MDNEHTEYHQEILQLLYDKGVGTRPALAATMAATMKICAFSDVTVQELKTLLQGQLEEYAIMLEKAKAWKKE